MSHALPIHLERFGGTFQVHFGEFWVNLVHLGTFGYISGDFVLPGCQFYNVNRKRGRYIFATTPKVYITKLEEMVGDMPSGPVDRVSGLLEFYRRSRP